MSDTYQKLVTKQRESQETRAKVNSWLKQNVDQDVESLQSIVLDEEALFIPCPHPDGVWDEDDDKFQDELTQAKEKIYSDLLAFLEDEKRESVVEVIDPTEPIKDEPKGIAATLGQAEATQGNAKLSKAVTNVKPKPSKDPVADAIVTLIKNAKGGVTEKRVREIVKEEIASALKSVTIQVNE